MYKIRKKPRYIQPSFLKIMEKFSSFYNSEKLSKLKAEGIEVWTRSSTILPEFDGIKIEIYNGRDFIPVMLKKICKI